MTARLATHPDVASRTSEVLDRLVRAGVDVDFLGGDTGLSGESGDPLQGVRDSVLDLALVGIRALRGSAADDLTTVAVLPREEYGDVLVALSGVPASLANIGSDARVGVCGERRLAFLRAHRPDVEPVILDAETLLQLAAGAAVAVDPAAGEEGSLVGSRELDALVMSAIEARRMGISGAKVEALDAKSWLPEPGQGALALIARHPIAEATALDHLPTRTALRAELALLDALDADARAPLGALAQPSGRSIRLWAAAASLDGRRLVRSDLTGPLDEPEALGAAVARHLTERGIGLVLSESVG